MALNDIISPPDSIEIPSAMWKSNIDGISAKYQTQQRIPDFRRYEVKDHLGNVRTVIADYKNPFSTSGPVSNWTYLADIKNISNMYPYGKSYGTNAIYNATDDYRYGFNGMEKEKNMDASGDITDFGARVFDANFPMFLSPDPMEKSFSYQSTYITSKNNPIENVDIDGKYSVTAHYNITYNSLMRIGFSSKQSAKIAHYSSVYADHPTLNALTANNILSLSYHQYVKGIDYTPTSESQAESNSKWHAMMSNEEADKGMSHSEAMNRGFEFGWDNILDQSEGLDVGKLGQGLHALQDAYAHKGASTKEHLTAKPTSFYSVTSMYYMINDLYGETNEANHITMSAGIILQAMNGNSSVYTKNGVLLNLEGMTKMQLEKTENILQNAGFEINELNGSKGKFFLMSKIKSKDE
ncbi:MAG: RHS repeat-associated core domain-containing protein [Candidatus Kapaibacterium sp.]